MLRWINQHGTHTIWMERQHRQNSSGYPIVLLQLLYTTKLGIFHTKKQQKSLAIQERMTTMNPEKIERINELKRLKDERGLTEEEHTERKQLHKEYISGFRQNMQTVLDNVRIKEADGTLTPLQKK